MNLKTKKSTFSKKKTLALVLAVVILACSGVYALEATNTIDLVNRDNNSDAQNEIEKISEKNDPVESQENPKDTTPVSNDPNSPDAAKDRALQNQADSQSNQKKQSTPIITNASNSFTIGYIPGTAEDNGNCTFTFTGNGTVVKKSSTKT